MAHWLQSGEESRSACQSFYVLRASRPDCRATLQGTRRRAKTNAGKALATARWRRRSWFRLGTLSENGTVYKRHWRSVLTATRRLDVQATGEETGHICPLPYYCVSPTSML